MVECEEVADIFPGIFASWVLTCLVVQAALFSKHSQVYLSSIVKAELKIIAFSAPT